MEENQALESFYAALRNLDKLEHEDFREIIKSQFNPTLRERYLTVNYHRAAFNVEMMLAIKDTKQFQTLSLLARTDTRQRVHGSGKSERQARIPSEVRHY